MYVVIYRGVFGFIKPWTAVRDGETFSQQFLTPSIVEGMEKKLFPELLRSEGIKKIKRHKLSYAAMDCQQEVVQTRGVKVDKRKEYRTILVDRIRSVLKRDVLLNPVLYLAFDNENDAQTAAAQHICLCRNEDILLPDADVRLMTEKEFDELAGFELRFEKSGNSVLVGYNRFDSNSPMYGRIETKGK